MVFFNSPFGFSLDNDDRWPGSSSMFSSPHRQYSRPASYYTASPCYGFSSPRSMRRGYVPQHASQSTVPKRTDGLLPFDEEMDEDDAMVQPTSFTRGDQQRPMEMEIPIVFGGSRDNPGQSTPHRCAPSTTTRSCTQPSAYVNKPTSKHNDCQSAAARRQRPIGVVSPCTRKMAMKKDEVNENEIITQEKHITPGDLADNNCKSISTEIPIAIERTANETGCQTEAVEEKPRVRAPVKKVLTATEQLEEIDTELTALDSRLEAFNGSTKAREYIYIDEMLTKALIQLDAIESGGDEVIRNARKSHVRRVQSLISRLEKKVGIERKEEDTPVGDMEVEEGAGEENCNVSDLRQISDEGQEIGQENCAGQETGQEICEGLVMEQENNKANNAEPSQDEGRDMNEGRDAVGSQEDADDSIEADNGEETIESMEGREQEAALDGEEHVVTEEVCDTFEVSGPETGEVASGVSADGSIAESTVQHDINKDSVTDIKFCRANLAQVDELLTR